MVISGVTRIKSMLKPFVANKRGICFKLVSISSMLKPRPLEIQCSYATGISVTQIIKIHKSYFRNEEDNLLCRGYIRYFKSLHLYFTGCKKNHRTCRLFFFNTLVCRDGTLKHSLPKFRYLVNSIVFNIDIRSGI